VSYPPAQLRLHRVPAFHEREPHRRACAGTAGASRLAMSGKDTLTSIAARALHTHDFPGRHPITTASDHARTSQLVKDAQIADYLRVMTVEPPHAARTHIFLFCMRGTVATLVIAQPI